MGRERPVHRVTTMALIHQELECELDELVARHAPTLAALVTCAITQPKPSGDQDPVALLRWRCQAFAKRSLSQVVQALLSWLNARGQDQIASWLVAHLLLSVLEEAKDAVPLSVQVMAKVSDNVLNASVHVFQESYQWDCAKANESAGGFFTFKSSSAHSARPPTAEATLQDRVVGQWRLVLARLALSGSLHAVRVRFQIELSTPNHQPSKQHSSSGLTRPHAFLQHLSKLRLNLTPASSSPIALKTKEAGLFLKLLHPFMLKPNKTPMRLHAIAIVASIIQRELQSLDRANLHLVYTNAHVGEWNSCLSDLHALAMKSCSKKDLAAAAWELRIAVLCIAPMDIFTRYWKDDVHALLRLQYQHNKDGHSSTSGGQTTLECIALSFRHVLLRHFIMDRSVPSESDCMEIINTMQAWCFFSASKHKGPLHKFREGVLPALVDISVGIAAYNMTYTVQSHLRRLLMEAESIFDEKKLVGLGALVRIYQECSKATSDTDAGMFQLDRSTLQSNRHVLGDLVGHILIECNTSFGQEAGVVMPASVTFTGSSALSTSMRFMRDDHKRAVAIEIFGTALSSLQYVYTALELSEDQKLLLLARATIHSDLSIRQSANKALHAIVCITEKPKAGLVIRGLTDFLLRLSNGTASLGDATAFSILIRLIASLLDAASRNDQALVHWESSRHVEDSLVRIEAACLYVLVYEDTQLHLHTLDALKAVRTARRRMPLSLHQQSVLDVIDALEPELGCAFFSFESTTKVESYFQRLAGHSSFTRTSFRWSYCLSLLYTRLSRSVPEVAASIWAELSDKALKLEPVMPSMGDQEGSNSAVELSCWRNLAIFCTSTACVMPCNSVNATSGDPSSSVQSGISMNAVVTLFKRLGRYLKSFSMDQKKAVILALGSTNASSLPILMEVLDKYEPEAFEAADRRSLLPQQQSQRTESMGDMNAAASGTLDTISNRKHSKVFKAKSSKPVVQLHLQWAIGRCYRICLHTVQRYQLHINERAAVTECEAFLLAVRGFLGKMKLAMDSRSRFTIGKDNGHVYFMMQQDFCAAIRAYMHLTACSSATFVHESAGNQDAAVASSPIDVAIPKHTREGIFELLRSWASSSLGSFVGSRSRTEINNVFFEPNARLYDYWIYHCDVFGDHAYDRIVPWHWMDEELRPMDSDGIMDSQLQASQHLFTCQSTFSALAALLEGPGPIDSTVSVFKWMDECFAVNATEITSVQPLQHFCKRGLHALLHSEFRVFSAICVEKSHFTRSGPELQLIAKRFFEALGDHENTFRIELERQYSQQNYQGVVRVLHMLLLHLGVQNDETHREFALNTAKSMLSGLLDWPPEVMIRDAKSRSSRDSSVLANQITNHSQILVSTALARKFSAMSLAFCSSLLQALKDCDGSLQNQMLAVIVPWISELDLAGAPTDNNGAGAQRPFDSLLALLFHTTFDLSGTNSDHLEHMWLALAFHQRHSAQSSMGNSNLSVVVQFLFAQRASLEQLDTARLVLWWLCRWQQASPQVIRALADCVLERRRQHTLSIDGGDGDDTNPVDDLSVFVALICDSSSLLRVHSSGRYGDLIVQVIHNVLLTLFAVIERKYSRPSMDQNNPRLLRISRLSVQKQQLAFDLERMTDVHQDCLSVLRAVRSPDHFTPISECICDGLDNNSHPSALEAFRELLRSFASSMSTEELAVWTDVCVTEILLAISTPNAQASVSLGTVSLNGSQPVTCVRFALLAYETVAPAFHGDVHLSVLELLHTALDGQQQDLKASIVLVEDCLTTLAGLTRRMPVAQLALYPQILWVCLALLNHCKQHELHPSILALLLEILSKPHFATNQLLQDVFMSKRPAQWTNQQQCSILQSVTANLQGCCLQSRKLARRIIMQLVLFPQQFLCMDLEEHLIISTISLLPELEASLSVDAETEPCSASDECQLLDAFSSLSALLSESKYDSCNQLGQWLEQYTTPDQLLTPTQVTSFAESFAAIFIPMLLEEQHCCPQLDTYSTCVDILLRMSFPQGQNEDSNTSSEDRRPLSVAEDPAEAGIARAALRILDALLVQLESQSFSWTPPASLLSSLVQMAHAPKQRAQWQTVVRVVSYIAATSDTISLPDPVRQQQRRHLSIAIPTPEAPAPATAPTPAKRDSLGSARKFMNLMTMRSSNNSPQSESQPSSISKHKDPAASQKTSVSDQQQSGEDVRI